jgi:hypothetical protein
MAEYIKRADAIAAIIMCEAHEKGSEGYNIGLLKATSVVDLVPTADVKPVVHGKWRRIDAYPHRLYCSACFRSYLPNDEILQMYRIPMNYCPNCGAKMDGEK